MVYTWQSEELMNKLRSGSNLRTDCTVFVKSEWLKADNTEEIARLEERAKRLTIDIAELGELIESNSWYWEHTTVQAEKDKRHAFNEELRMQKAYNEGKLKVVQGCLKNLE
jgi:hypothetical protein